MVQEISTTVGRPQCVWINLVLSEKGVIKNGIPQGSVLVAILFIIYI